MEVDKKLVREVASLARLNLTQKEVEEFTPQLSEVLKAFDKLKELNTEKVEISLHPVTIKGRTREDKEKKGRKNEEVLKLSGHKKDGYFKGPKVK